MTPRGGRERPATTTRARVVGLLALLGLALAGPVDVGAADGPPSTAARGTKVPTIHHKSRSFRIPFNVDAADRPKLVEVQLWVSDDSGFTWKTVSRTTPDRPAFTFRAAKDGEYWFAVRTLDTKGQLYPGADEQVEPSMKVVVDTSAPSLVLEPDGRRGSVAAVRWDVRDEHLDLKSLVIEYQVEGGRDWRKVPIHRAALIGSESWDAGTAEPLKARAMVSDKAGNSSEALISISEGTPANPSLGRNKGDEFSSPSPIAPISSGPTFPEEEPVAVRPRASGAPAFATSDPFSSGPGAAASFADASPTVTAPPAASGPDPFGDASGPPAVEPPPRPPAQPPIAAEPTPTPAPNPTPAPTPAPAQEPATQTLLVSSPRFPLRYMVDDAGPGGPATVELWVTQDGGRTWYRKAEDPDRVSPFNVDLGSEGTFGLRLVARGASGLGDAPPANGDPPHFWVEVDGTAPLVQLGQVVVGTGKHMGKVAIDWRASDVHLATAPVTIYWRAVDQPGGAWQKVTDQPVENSGRFIWNVPNSVPPRFLLRVEVADTAGNQGFAETPESTPVLVDRTRPKSRILGLDTSARSGMGPSARPMR